MEMIKAIETQYKGYRFRSRLEARWAVFFDEANVRYEYEPEGYELNDGIKYLPDFYLPEFQLFVEIKPLANNRPGWREECERWEEKCREFRSSIGKAIMIVYGDPAEDVWGRLFAWRYDDNGGGEFDEHALFTGMGAIYKPSIVVLTFGGKDETVAVAPDMTVNKRVINPSMMIDYYWEDAYSLLTAPMTDFFNPNDDIEGSLNSMKKKARQARFEHGEKPNNKSTECLITLFGY